MKENKVKRMMRDGEVTLGAWLSTGSLDVAEIMANAGFDWLVIDMEHGPVSIETTQALMQAMNGTDTVPIVRVPWNDQVVIKRALDIGAYGLVVPMVNDKEAATAAVQAARYPPVGIRGVGPRRAAMYGFDAEYFQKANDEIIVIVQIEHEDAVKNVEDIARVPGVEVLFIGPMDLSASMGITGQIRHPRMIEAVDKVLDAAKKTGVPAGIFALGTQDANERVAQGFQFVSVGMDTGFLIQGCRTTLNNVKRVP